MVFVTGATGFIGRHLLRRMETAKFGRVYCLGRSPARMPADVLAKPGVVFLQGDLEDAGTYAEAYAGTYVEAPRGQRRWRRAWEPRRPVTRRNVTATSATA